MSDHQSSEIANFGLPPEQDLTPVLQQYLRCKRQYPEALLIFRMGDFYEVFGNDAKTISHILGLTLTARENRGFKVPMCGVPYHAWTRHLKTLLDAGHTVSIADQLEDPKIAKGLVKRDITRILTPGTLVEEELLEPEKGNYLASVFIAEPTLREQQVGIAILESSGGVCHIAELPATDLSRLVYELGCKAPRELLIPEQHRHAEWLEGLKQIHPELGIRLQAPIPIASDINFFLKKRLHTQTLASLAIEDLPTAQAALYQLMRYLQVTFRVDEPALTIRRMRLDQQMQLPTRSIRDLEIIDSPQGLQATLLQQIGRAVGAAGKRLQREWLVSPITDQAELNNRHNAVQILLSNHTQRRELTQHLAVLADWERISRRILLNRTNPRELVAVRSGLLTLDSIRPILRTMCEQAAGIVSSYVVLPIIPPKLLECLKMLEENAPADILQGNIFCKGYFPQIDHFRTVKYQGVGWFQNYEEQLREETGIRSLKIKNTPAFGWAIDVSNANQGLVPDSWQRRQTLKASERYVTEELLKHERELAEAEARLTDLERDAYNQFIENLKPFVDELQTLGHAVAALDVLTGFAESAFQRKLVRPQLNNEGRLNLVKGRHLAVEAQLGEGRFIKNDAQLDRESQQIALITGPNMGGKSTYLRMIAHACILAQCGSYVPGTSADLPLLHRLFTRIGAGDALARGESTFMVEMIEVAETCHNADNNTLVILDEVGRGTSTYDGVAVAKAVVEWLHGELRVNESEASRPLVLFATHYHELTDLAQLLPRVFNLQTVVHEEKGHVTFLYRVESGASDRSFGIHVAALAGLPRPIIDRALIVLTELETLRQESLGKARKIVQLKMFE